MKPSFPICSTQHPALPSPSDSPSTRQTARRRLRRFPSWFLLLPLLLLFGVPAPANTLPDLGNPARQALTAQERQALRMGFLRTLYDEGLVSDDMALQSWLNRLGRRLARHLPEATSLTFLVIDSPEINAFAGPEGVIGVHTGLILAAEREDEVAAVLAHEIAHVTQHHLLRRIQHSRRDSLGTFAAALAAILVGQQNPQAGAALFYSGLGYSLQQQLAFSRAHETEADAEGIRLLAQAGYDPDAMRRFFDRLQRLNDFDGATLPEILRTHPVTLTRLRLAQSRAETLRQTPAPPMETSPLFFMMQLRIDPDHAQSLEQLPARIQPLLQCYRTSLKTARPPACLSEPAADDLWPLQLQRLLLLDTLPPDQRETVLHTLVDRFPRHPAILLAAARQALEMNRLQTARQWLERLPDHPPFSPVRYRLAARIHDLNHQPAAARLMAAFHAWHRGYIRQAGNLLEQLSADRLPPELRPAYLKLKQRVERLTPLM